MELFVIFCFVYNGIVYHCILFVIALRDFGGKRFISTVFIIIIIIILMEIRNFQQGRLFHYRSHSTCICCNARKDLLLDQLTSTNILNVCLHFLMFFVLIYMCLHND